MTIRYSDGVLRSITRRELLALASAAAFAPRAGAAPTGSMPARAIPGTGETLPIVGLGSTRPVTAIAERGPEFVEAVVRALAEHGGRVVDTWPRSDFNDDAFGEIISAPDLRDRLFVTINLEQQGAQAGRAHFERTLRLYRRERIDLVNVGSLIDLEAQWPNLRAFKDDGRARYIGVTAAQAALYDQLETFLVRERPDFARDFANFTMAAQAVRRDGSAAIDLAYVACGRFDGFFEDGLSPWDTAAGMVLIQEARGRVTNFDDQPLDVYTQKVLASNGLIHDAMRNVLRRGTNRSL